MRNLPANGDVCTSIIPSGHSLTYAAPAENSYTASTTTFTDSALLLAVPVEGYNFYQSLTLPSINSITSPTPTPTSQSTSIAASPSPSDVHEGGLSSGAKIGIGVGVGVGGFALIAIIAAVLIRRWRRRGVHQHTPVPTEMPDNDAGRGGNIGYKPYQPPEMYSPPPEIDGRARPAELSG